MLADGLCNVSKNFCTGLTLRPDPGLGRDNNPLPDVEKMRIAHGASNGFVDLSPFPLGAIELFGELAQVIPRL